MATFNTAFGALPSAGSLTGQRPRRQQGFGQQPGQQPGQQAQDGEPRDFMQQFRAQQQGQQQGQQQPQRPQQTFAQMQQQGQARPAPPQAQPAQPPQQPQPFQAQAPSAAPQFGGSQQAQQLRNQLQQQLGRMAQTPSRFDTQAFQQIRGAQAANLQQEYRGQQQALDEELARRGLFASSIGGGRMGDLAGQQARALSSLDAQLLQQAAQTQAQDRESLIRSQMGLAELAGSQDLAAFEATQRARTQEQELGLRTGELTGQVGGQKTIAAQSLEQQRADTAAERELRQTMQTRDLTAQEAQQLRDIETRKALQTQQIGAQREESAAERDIRMRLQAGQITAAQAQQERDQVLERERMAQQGQQFTVEQELRRLLGLGGLDVQREQLGLETRRLEQQRQDQAAERTLRETLQTRELSAQERQQLADIEARKTLQTQQIAEQARQFGLQLTEQQAARVQQGGFTTEELAISRQRVDNELSLQNRQLTETERNNLAIRNLQRDQFNSEKDFRADQLQLNRDELEQRAAQITEDQRLRGVEIDDQRAYREAEIEARTAQIANEYERSGQQIDVETARITAQRDLNAADNTAQMNRLTKQLTSQETIATAERDIQQRQLAFQNAARLSEQSGIQYTVNAQGVPEVVRDAQGNPVRTSAFTQAEEARRQQDTLTRLDIQLRQQLGLMEATGQAYTVDAQGRLVQATGPNTQTLQARQIATQERQLAFQNAQRLSEQSGIQYTVDANNNAVVLRDAQNNPVRTSAFTQAEEARKLQEGSITGTLGGRLTQEALQNAYARAAQLSQATGQQYTVDTTTGAITQVAGESGRTFAAQLQAAGLTGTFGGALTQEALQNAYQRAAQLSQVTGQQYTVNPRTGEVTAATSTGGGMLETLAAQLQRAELTGQMGGQDTLARRAQELSQLQFLTQQTGNIYQLGTGGRVEPGSGTTIAGQQASFERAQQQAAFMSAQTGMQYQAVRDPATGMFSLQQVGGAAGTVTEARRQADLERALRSALGMSEATGFVYDPTTGQRTAQETVQGQLARNQMMMSLVQVLGNLTPEQVAQLIGTRTTPTPSTTPSTTATTIFNTPTPTSTIITTGTPSSTPFSTPTTTGIFGTPTPTATVQLRLPTGAQAITSVNDLPLGLRGISPPANAVYFDSGKFWFRVGTQWYSSPTDPRS